MLKELVNLIKQEHEHAKNMKKVGFYTCAREHEKKARELNLHLMLRD